jgi:hypothetical protein
MRKRIYSIKGYRPNLMPEPIKYDLSTKLPSLVSLGCNTKSNESHRAWIFERFTAQPLYKLTAEEYVSAFDLCNGLKPTEIEWVKPDYCFG